MLIDMKAESKTCTIYGVGGFDWHCPFPGYWKGFSGNRASEYVFGVRHHGGGYMGNGQLRFLLECGPKLISPQMQCLGEMATWLPVPGALPNFACRYVDKALGFAVGWNVSAQYLSCLLPLELSADNRRYHLRVGMASS